MREDSELVSLVIATRNRKELLRDALQSCFAQTYRPIEVIVYDDNSTDGTEELVRAAFPEALYFRQVENVGIAALRNLGLHQARGEYVFSIDDDAYYTDSTTLEQAVDLFKRYPQVAALAMRFIEPYRGNPALTTSFATNEEGLCELSSFVSCAYGIRRKVAIAAGGYRDFYMYRGEEGDLSIRLLDRGYSIMYTATPPIVHLFSPARAWSRMMPLAIRNTFLTTFLNVPHPFLLPRLLVNAINLLRYKLTWRELPRRVWSIVAGSAACVRYARHRSAVSMDAYRRFRRLPRHGAEDGSPFGELRPLKRHAPEPDVVDAHRDRDDGDV